ncbi:hypothetical protein BGW36DRAFT_435126 [Talaromyces proteolyticus]|uniref:Uncharacterized protein n=1 Tax=Talaromyces proteolyticus TaxID=1131652 RepID=A0AAD4L2A7_9EURO|nr:uncharacterized protein BGW36DRAFT_435126 [Talaromyces proteolyticus]KAH8705315.1 hypothetical protein BGW36DRAFT_435126 [Talaromyces proteolyticus]
MGCERGIVSQVRKHLVLEDGAANGNADGLAQRTEETEHSPSHRHILTRDRDLNGNSMDGVQEDPRHSASMGFKDTKDAQAEHSNSPARSDSPTILAKLGDQDAGNSIGGRHSGCQRKHRNTGDDEVLTSQKPTCTHGLLKPQDNYGTSVYTSTRL